MDIVIKAAIGVVIAIAILFVIRVAYVKFIIHEVTSSITEMSNKQLERASARTAKATRDKKKLEMENRAAQELKRRKKLAWSKYYTQPEDCLSYRTQDHMIECGNIRITARRTFDKLWTEGALAK